MHITILTTGSRGDVQPYVALGVGLQAAGHDVRLATFAGFQSFVASYGIECFPVTPISTTITSNQDWLAWQRSGNTHARFIRLFRRVVRLARMAIAQMLIEYWIACQGTDVIISSLSGFGGPHIAEKLNVPHFWALLQPVSRTHAFPHFMTPTTMRLGSRISPLTYRCAERIFWWLFKWPINHLRQQVLGLPALSRPGSYGLLGKTRYPVLYGFSPSVIPKPIDWNEHTHVTGYWFLDRPDDWRQPEDLVAFLQAGSAPVYLGLGRMHIRDPAAHLELMLEVLSRLQKRAVVLSTGLDLRQSDLPNSVFSVDSVPHDWLFPHMSVIVHHGGAGTTASALRAGIPAFSVPGFFDQQFWGQCVPRLGTGPPPVLPHQLSAERLTAAITAADESVIRAQASRLGAQIRAEDGVRRAVEILNRYLAGA